MEVRPRRGEKRRSTEEMGVDVNFLEQRIEHFKKDLSNDSMFEKLLKGQQNGNDPVCKCAMMTLLDELANIMTELKEKEKHTMKVVEIAGKV